MLRWLPTLEMTVKVVLPALFYLAALLVFLYRDWLLLTVFPNITFERPYWLLLILVVPLIWIFSWNSLSGLGSARSLLAIGLRSFVLALIVMALAQAQYVQRTEKMTVMYLLDQSMSIPAERRKAMLEYVVGEVKRHRNAEREDRAGVIIFGREAKVESPPFDAPLEGIGSVESYADLPVDATNLASALKLAQATFPENTARRVVIVSDGNENLGNSQGVADAMAEAGIGIDVVPVTIGGRAEVAIEKVTIPVDVRKGQPFDVRVVVNNLTQATPDNPGIVRGKLKLIRRTAERDETHEEKVELPPGKKVFTIQQQVDQPNFYIYLAEFEPENPNVDDQLTQNNRASAFTHVRGRGHILLIEDWEHPGEFRFLEERLRAQNLEVTVQPSDQLFTSLAELQKFDTVVLANVARSSGGDERVTNFSDAQIAMLVRNVEQLGAGLVMLGGNSSYGAGGWTNTELEKAMPVDFQIQNTKVVPVGALVLTMHASELPDGNHWQKVIAQESIKALGAQDWCGVVQLDGQTGRDDWLWTKPTGMARVGPNRDTMLNKVGRMTPGDMPDFNPSMVMAAAAFARLPDAAVKHMIIISDGDPIPPSQATLNALIKAGAKVTTVAVGCHQAAGNNELKNIATQTGGTYYVVNNPKTLPRIYQREVRKVTKPLVYERDTGFSPYITYDHEILRGVGGVKDSAPPITGYVLTTKKQNPLVEVLIEAPEPSGEENNTILACWTFGLGRTAVLTTDAGSRWAASWTKWDKYDRLFSQLVRWSMRPVNEDGKFNIATDVKGGKVKVIVTALDQNDEFLNFLDFRTSVVGPGMEPFDVRVTQVAPGRYIGEFDARDAGSYFINLTPGAGKASLRTGVNVPYSPEFLDRETNENLLRQIAAHRPRGGEPGEVIQVALTKKIDDSQFSIDTFRHTLAKAVSNQDIWPFLIVIGAVAFFGDVLIRRVTMGVEWLYPAWAWMRRQVFGATDAVVVDERLARLKSKKAEVADELDERRAGSRFEPQPDAAPPDLAVLSGDAASRERPPAPASDQPGMTPAEKEADTYTARLLKAKQQAKKNKPD